MRVYAGLLVGWAWKRVRPTIFVLIDRAFMQIGELQCYDRRALASLAQAAQEKGHPEWGYTGPHDAGTYTSTPEVPVAVYHPLTDAA